MGAHPLLGGKSPGNEVVYAASSDIIENYLLSLISRDKLFTMIAPTVCNHLVLNVFRNICHVSGCSFQVMLQCLVAAVNSKF